MSPSMGSEETESDGVDREDDVAFKLNELIGSEAECVPLVQVIGPYHFDRNEQIVNFFKKRKLLYTYFDLAIYNYNGSNTLLNYEWNNFRNDVLNKLVENNKLNERKEDFNNLRNFDLDNGNKLTHFTKSLMSYLEDSNSNQTNKLVYVFDNYNDLINKNNNLLIKILKLHEHVYVSNFKPKKTKLVVVLVGLYEVPLNFQFNLPLPKVHIFPKKSIDHLANEIVRNNDKVDPNFAKYIVNILFKYYNNDIKSLILYTNLLKDYFNNNLQRELDMFLHNVVFNFKTRNVTEIFNKVGEQRVLASECCKVVLLSAYVSSNFVMKANTQYFRRFKAGEESVKVRKEDKRAKRENKLRLTRRKLNTRPKENGDSNYNNYKGEFSLKYWLAITELLMIVKNRREYLSSHNVHKNMMWLIEEGYVCVTSNAHKYLIIGKSGLIFGKNQKESSKSNFTEVNNLSLLNGNMKFCLNVSREVIGNIISEVNVDLKLLFNISGIYRWFVRLAEVTVRKYIHQMLNRLIFRPNVFRQSIASQKGIRSFSSYDIFKKLEDSINNEGVNEETRKPSLKVTKLVDEILNLTLIEAADLCNLCQEKLSNNANFNNNIPGRMPFPHPSTFFQNVGYNNMFQAPNLQESTSNQVNEPSNSPSDSNENLNKKEVKSEKAEKKEDKKSLKLVGFNKDKKIEIIKTIRDILNINLRESKEFIESYPKVIKKNISGDEIEKLSKMITDSGGVVEVE